MWRADSRWAARGGNLRHHSPAAGPEQHLILSNLTQVDAKKHKIEMELALVLMPTRLRVPLPCPELPELVLSAITAIQVRINGSNM